MKSSRQIVLVVALAVLSQGVALAENIYPTSGSSPAYVSQSLPPMNANTPGYTNYGNTGQYNQPSYQQPQQYGQQPYSQPYGQPYAQPYGGQQAPLQGYVMTAPAGTVVTATTTTPISSEYARVGDRVMVTLGSPVAAGSSVLLPSGSQVEGQVVMVREAGRTGRNGELEIRFTSAMLPNGQRIPLSARIQTEDGTGIIKGGTTAGRVGKAALRTGIGAGLGAALGTAMGPLSGGEVGRGAIYGTALGGGLGALSAAWQKGEPAVIEAGQPMNVVLDQPLTTSPTSTSDPGGYQQVPSYQPNPQPYNFYGQ